MSVFIHPTAIISEKAQLGENVKIGPYAVVDDNVIIGDGTELKPFSHVCDYTKVGKNCTFFEHSVIGGEPQDLKFKGEITWTIIGDNVVCREFVTVNRAAGEGNITKIGDNAFIMESVHVAHNVIIGNNCIIANMTGIAGHVEIGDFVVIGGMSGIHQFVKIGSYSMIGGMSRLTQDVPPFSLASGEPCEYYDINRVGLQRNGFASKERMKIREFYKVVYSPENTKSDAVRILEQNYADDKDARMIIDFIKSSTRGLIHSVKYK